MKQRAGENLVKQLLLLVVLVPVEPLLVELDHHLPKINSPLKISVSDPDSITSVDLYPDPYSESGTFINEQRIKEPNAYNQVKSHFNHYRYRYSNNPNLTFFAGNSVRSLCRTTPTR
jgi:hypothetical protein